MKGPMVNIGGKKKIAAASWMKDNEATDAAHSWRALRRQRPKWRDSKTRWSSEGSSSRWKLRAHGTEFSRRLSSVGERMLVSVTGSHTGTCWHTWGYSGSTPRLIHKQTRFTHNNLRPLKDETCGYYHLFILQLLYPRLNVWNTSNNYNGITSLKNSSKLLRLSL